MDIIYTLQANSWLFYTAIVFFGLSVGSFLNVVAYRLPIILNREWKQQCHEYLETDPPEPDPEIKDLSLSSPRSTCPNCGHMITVIENIPVVSYLLLRGRCASCKNRISFQYPLVELFTAAASVAVAYRFGISIQTVAALFFTWALIALTLIDIHKQLLPDIITLPLMWLGLLLAIFEVFTNIQSSVIGAMAGYLILWSVFQGFLIITGKEGMGHGDFKLLAALGAWFGWELLPQIILLSSVVGTILGLGMLLTGKTEAQSKIPFGPYLALAGWIALIWGDQLNHLYYSIL